MKRANIISLVLLIYLVVLSVLAYPTYQESGDWTRYILIIAGQLVIIYLLRYFSLKKAASRIGKIKKKESEES